MSNYKSTTEFESKIVPGAVFHLRKLSHGRRMELNAKAAEIFDEINKLGVKQQAILEEITRAEGVAKLEPCMCDHLPDIHDQDTGRCTMFRCECRKPMYDPEIGGPKESNKINSDIVTLIVSKLYPVYIRWGIKDITGFEIDNKQVTPDLLLSDGPEGLVEEIGSEIQRILKMSPEEVLGFKSPTTSSAVVDGQAKTPDTEASNAPTVNGTDSTLNAIAANTSPN